MAPFLKGHRKGHHIFEASTTCLYLRRALQVLYYTASQGGQVLFMGKSPKVSGITKGQSKRHNPYVRILETAAIACSQPYFNGDSQSKRHVLSFNGMKSYLALGMAVIALIIN